MIELSFVKRIVTTKYSIFYSLIHYSDHILGFGRKTFEGAERQIKVVKFNDNFDIIIENIEHLKGEDPRCFMHQNRLYVVDNYCNDVHLIDYQTKERTKIPLSGKNFSFISHNNILYIIHTMIPLHLYKFDIQTKQLSEVYLSNNIPNKEYRGGTPGYHKEDKIYYGFGHRTYQSKNGLTHDIYYWDIDFSTSVPSLTIKSFNQPSHSKTITDPTSVIFLNDHRYLITAESDHAWNRDQDYITNVYEIDYLYYDPIVIVPLPPKRPKSWKNYFWSLFNKKSP